MELDETLIMHSQGAAYPSVCKQDYKLEDIWVLFDACGPERETGLGNPRPRPVKPAS